MIIGTGIDIIEVHRVDALLARGGDRFVRRWFSPGEIEYCRARARPAQHLAARLAAKEAAIKALGPAWTAGLLLREIEVVTDGRGAPGLRLGGRAAEMARRAGVTALFVSLSHAGAYAAATVIAEGSSLSHATPR